MREIKFRQPIIRVGRIVQWHYWGFIKDGFVGPVHLNGKQYQLTEKLDKSGKEIYEGDILNLKHEYDMQENFELSDLIGDTCYLRMFGPGEIEIIGNVHENSELLK